MSAKRNRADRPTGAEQCTTCPKPPSCEPKSAHPGPFKAGKAPHLLTIDALIWDSFWITRAHKISITQNPVPERECGFKSHLRHHRLWLHRAISEIVARAPAPTDRAMSGAFCRRLPTSSACFRPGFLAPSGRVALPCAMALSVGSLGEARGQGDTIESASLVACPAYSASAVAICRSAPIPVRST